MTTTATAFTPKEIITIMSGLMLAMALASLDQTVVATALSPIARDLGGWELMSWVVSAYLVASTTTTPIYGRLSDLYGRRRILLISIGIFVGASILSALATTMPQLILTRVLQGLGGGGLRSVSQATVADIVPPRERGRYQGYFSIVFVTSNSLGPVLGGAIADGLSWHWIFWINVPLGLVALAMCNRVLARLPVPQRKPIIDWLGALLILCAATPTLIGVSSVTRNGWLSFSTLGMLALGIVSLVLLVLRERVAPEPMLPLRLFANRVFSLASAVTFLSSMVMIGSIIMVPIAYQLIAGVSAKDAGARMIPMTVGTVVGSFIAGQLITRTGHTRIFPIIGTACGAIFCAVISYVGLGRTIGFDLAATAALGLSFGCQLAPMTVTAQNALDIRDTGIGMSCLMFARLIGGAFGVAILSSVLIAGLAAAALRVPGHEVLGPDPGIALFHLDEHRADLSPALLAALTGGIPAAFARVFALGALLMASASAFAVLIREIPLRGGEPKT